MRSLARACALLLPIALALLACEERVLLEGHSDLGAASTPEIPAVPSCPSSSEGASDGTVVDGLADWGELRAIGAARGMLYMAFAADRSSSTVFARVPSTGGAPAEVARVGEGPIAFAIDEVAAYIATDVDARIHRVQDGTSFRAASESNVATEIVTDGEGRAFWVREGEAEILTWLLDETPRVLATGTRPRALAYAQGTLYFVDGSDDVLALAVDFGEPPRRLGSCPGARSLATALGSLYCATSDQISRIDLTERSAPVVIATGEQEIESGIVAARGRLFWGARAFGDPSHVVKTLPLDGVGGSTIVHAIQGRPALFTTDGCNLYVSDGTSVDRKAL